MAIKIWIVEDEPDIANLVAFNVRKEQFEANVFHDGESFLEAVKNGIPDLVILDIMLPDMDGFEVCRVIRQTSNIPIIMLTARGEVTDKVVGLELGADDYLAKPFEPRELVARIQSVLRRIQQLGDNQTLTFERLTIDLDKRIALLDGTSLDLTTNEFAALALLARNAGKVLNRDQILQELRGMDCDAFNRSVDIAVSRLRQKLNDNPKSPEFIKTVWGIGYVFIAN